jgi:hypothetical protein
MPAVRVQIFAITIAFLGKLSPALSNELPDSAGGFTKNDSKVKCYSTVICNHSSPLKAFHQQEKKTGNV